MYRGKYKPKGMVVAVKTCRDTLSEDQRKKFLQEGRILKQYDHPNIVKFIGIAAQRQPVMIVMEYVEGKGGNSVILIYEFSWILETLIFFWYVFFLALPQSIVIAVTLFDFEEHDNYNDREAH